MSKLKLFAPYRRGNILEQIATSILCVTALFFIVVFGAVSLSSFLHNPAPIRISQSSALYIEKELTRRCADDCILTPMSSGGWKCKEIKSGKVFKVAAK